MKQVFILAFSIFVFYSSFSQNLSFKDQLYLIKLEKEYTNLVSDTIRINAKDEQGQLVVTWHKQYDTTVLKRLIYHNYYSSYSPSISIRTEYFNKSKRCLGWTLKDFNLVILAGELNYFDKKGNLIESFVWNTEETGLRTKYIYTSAGSLEKVIKSRGDKIIEEK